MYIWIKLQRESYEYWKKHFNSPDTPWTAEFMMGWKMTHRPWMSLLGLLEMTVEIGIVIILFVHFGLHK